MRRALAPDQSCRHLGASPALARRHPWGAEQVQALPARERRAADGIRLLPPRGLAAVPLEPSTARGVAQRRASSSRPSTEQWTNVALRAKRPVLARSPSHPIAGCFCLTRTSLSERPGLRAAARARAPQESQPGDVAHGTALGQRASRLGARRGAVKPGGSQHVQDSHTQRPFIISVRERRKLIPSRLNASALGGQRASQRAVHPIRLDRKVRIRTIRPSSPGANGGPPKTLRQTMAHLTQGVTERWARRSLSGRSRM